MIEGGRLHSLTGKLVPTVVVPASVQSRSGDRVSITLPSEHVHLFDAESDEAIRLSKDGGANSDSTTQTTPSPTLRCSRSRLPVPQTINTYQVAVTGVR